MQKEREGEEKRVSKLQLFTLDAHKFVANFFRKQLAISLSVTRDTCNVKKVHKEMKFWLLSEMMMEAEKGE